MAQAAALHLDEGYAGRHVSGRGLSASADHSLSAGHTKTGHAQHQCDAGLRPCLINQACSLMSAAVRGLNPARCAVCKLNQQGAARLGRALPCCGGPRGDLYIVPSTERQYILSHQVPYFGSIPYT
jgi:hypothetical protein